MGQPSLVKKLNVELSQPITTERQVVYLLVEIRKLLEIQNLAGYSTLRLYCNWAVHSRLDNKSATDIIKIFDDIEDLRQSGKQKEKEQLMNAAKARLGMDAFRKELETFLQSQALNTGLCSNEAQWRAFLEQYIRVIEDVPLEFVHTPIKHIRSVAIKLFKDKARLGIEKQLWRQEGHEEWHFEINWIPTLFSGTTAPIRHREIITSDIKKPSQRKQPQG